MTVSVPLRWSTVAEIVPLVSSGVRELVRVASEDQAPNIVLIDETDAVGTERYDYAVKPRLLECDICGTFSQPPPAYEYPQRTFHDISAQHLRTSCQRPVNPSGSYARPANSGRRSRSQHVLPHEHPSMSHSVFDRMVLTKYRWCYVSVIRFLPMPGTGVCLSNSRKSRRTYSTDRNTRFRGIQDSCISLILHKCEKRLRATNETEHLSGWIVIREATPGGAREPKPGGRIADG